MAWTRKDKKQFRKALQSVYRDYSRLKIFVAEELDWHLESIVASSQPMDTVSFDLVRWAEGNSALQELYEAFREENPKHPFQLQTQSKPQQKPQQPPAPEPTPTTEINQENQSSGDNIAGNKYVYYAAQHPSPEPVSVSKPAALSGKPFNFTAASVTLDGQITKRRGERVRHIFDLGSTPLEMVWVPAGSFFMGSHRTEKGRNKSEGPQHRVTFAQGFWMGRYPITQAQWRWGARLSAFALSLLLSHSPYRGNEFPVSRVSWDDAREFCQRLSRELSQDFRLPSEAQWEYACRAGKIAPFTFGETLTLDLATYLSVQKDALLVFDLAFEETLGAPFVARKLAAEVGRFPANVWGLHDMHGYPEEWCEDTWHDDYEGAPTNGSPWVDGTSTNQLVRGCSWGYGPEICRSASRRYNLRESRCGTMGFRVVCSASTTFSQATIT